MSQEKGSEMFPSATGRKEAAKTRSERGTSSKHSYHPLSMKPLLEVERDSGASGSPSQQVERDSWPHQTKPGPEPSKHQLGLPPIYQRRDSGMSDSFSSVPSPSASFMSRGSVDSGVGISLSSSFFPSLSESQRDLPTTPETEGASFSISSNTSESDQLDYSSLQPPTPQPSHTAEEPPLIESKDEVDGCESHENTLNEDPNSTITEDRGRSSTLVDQEKEDIEEPTNVDTTPTNSPKTTRELSVTNEAESLFADMSLSYDYQKYLESFFEFFVNGLCLREDTAYAVFNSKDVLALGFGIKKDRVIPCLRVCSHLPSSEWPELQKEVGSHLMAAIKKAELADETLSLSDVMNYTEMDSVESSIFRPEELMSGVSPGEQFKVKEEYSCGTIGYYIKGKLKVQNSEQVEVLERHFGITCAHCAVPTSFMWWVVDAANGNSSIRKDYDNYPMEELFGHLWEDSRHQAQVSKLKSLLKGESGSTGPAVYNGLESKQELCFLKASICPQGMREVLKQENIHYINNKTTPSSKESDYEFVLCKFGMIPRQLNIPLPTYVFRSKCRGCTQDKCKCVGLEHYPFNVDVGVLEVKEPFGSLSLSSAIREKPNPVIVSSFDKDDPLVQRKERFEFQTQASSQHKTSPTSGFVQPRPREEESTSRDQESASGSMSCDQGSTSHDQGSMSCDQGWRSCDQADRESVSYTGISPSCEAHCVVNQFPLLHDYQKTNKAAIPPQEPSPIKKKKGSNKERIRQVASTVIATGMNIFNKKEQKHLQLQVLSSNGATRPQRRKMTVKNSQFCLEFVHRNPENRSQLRSFPTIKWKPEADQNDFIIRGDSGSSLFLVNHDSSDDSSDAGRDRLVLLGIVGSPSTGTRVDFIRKVIAPDLCQYMVSELLKDQQIDSFLRNACENLLSRLSITKQLEKLQFEKLSGESDVKSFFQRMCNELQTREYTCDGGNKVTFEITECIDECM